MGLLDRLRSWGRKSSTLDLFRDIYGGTPAKSGASVTWKTSLEVTTVLACAGVIADGVATVPLKLMRKTAGGARAVASDHPLADLLSVAPNDWMDSLELRETIAFHMALCGNAYLFVNRVRGRIAELIPIEPGRVQVKQGADYALRYEVTAPDGTSRPFPAESIWHIRGPSWNGWMGMETVRQAREAIGLALVTEESHARLHKNGVRPSGLYSVEGNLSPEQYKALRAYLDSGFAGAENAAKMMIVDRNARFTPLNMTGVDAQHLETRRFQIEEICRAFRVMPIMVGYSDKAATYASAEQMFLAHAVHCIRPWHRRLEASIARSLLTPAERAQGLYPKFFDAELLRGASRDRGEYYARGIQSGWMTRNEAREFEDMDPIDGLSEPLTPVNMTIGNPEPQPTNPDPAATPASPPGA